MIARPLVPTFVPVIDEIEALAAAVGLRTNAAIYKVKTTLSASTTASFSLQLNEAQGPLFVTRCAILDAAEAVVSDVLCHVKSGTRELTENGRVLLEGAPMQEVGPIVVLRAEQLVIAALFSGLVSADRTLLVEGFHLVEADGNDPGPSADAAARTQLKRGEWSPVLLIHAVGDALATQEWTPQRPTFFEALHVASSSFDGVLKNIKLGARNFTPGDLSAGALLDSDGSSRAKTLRIRTWSRGIEKIKSEVTAPSAGTLRLTFYARTAWV
jgi:hypothetical protein